MTKGKLQIATNADFCKFVYGLFPRAELQKLTRLYGLWIAMHLSQGTRVHISGVGMISASYRKGRRNVGSFKAYQPARWVLKLKASPGLKKLLVKLAADGNTKHFGFNGKSGPVPSERMAKV